MLDLLLSSLFFFFFNDTATTEIYTLSLHDALPISFKSRETGLSIASARTAQRRSHSTKRVKKADCHWKSCCRHGTKDPTAHTPEVCCWKSLKMRWRNCLLSNAKCSLRMK